MRNRAAELNIQVIEPGELSPEKLRRRLKGCMGL